MFRVKRKKEKIYFTNRLYNATNNNKPDFIRPLNRSHAAFYFNELELNPSTPFTREMVNNAYDRFLSYYEEYLALGHEPSFDIGIKAAARDYLLNYYDYAAFIN
jgi:hypothetical protein